MEGSTQAHILGRHLTAQSASASAKLNKLGGDSGAWVGEMTFLDKLGEKERLKSAPKNERQKTDQQQKEMNENSMDDRNKATNAESSAEIIKKVDETSESSEAKDTIVLYTVLAKENCKVWRWSFEDMEVLMSSSTVSFTISRLTFNMLSLPKFLMPLVGPTRCFNPCYDSINCWEGG